MTPNDLDLLLLLAAHPTLTIEEAERQLAALRRASTPSAAPIRPVPSAPLDESPSATSTPRAGGV